MKLKELLKPENIGLKIRYREWDIGYYVTITRIDNKGFSLRYSDSNSEHQIFNWYNAEGNGEWEILNSSKIRQRLGVK